MHLQFSFACSLPIAVEEDRAWFAMEEEEEINLKLEVADDLWGDLLTDTARVVAELDSRHSRRR